MLLLDDVVSVGPLMLSFLCFNASLAQCDCEMSMSDCHQYGKPVREGVHGHKNSESQVWKARGADIFETALCLVSLYM